MSSIGLVPEILTQACSSSTRALRVMSKPDRVCQREEWDTLEATVSAFLTVGFFGLFGQAHDELESKFIVATFAVASQGWICLSDALVEPCASSSSRLTQRAWYARVLLVTEHESHE
jgi:hypothetical protein